MGRTLFFLLFCCCANVSANNIHFIQGWLRETPKENSSAAIYGRLVNNSERSELLESIRSEQANLVMLHKTVRQQGMVGMKHLESLKIAPGETIYLEPGGSHFMAIGLSETLVEGDCLELILSFRSGKELKVVAKVGSIIQVEYPRSVFSCLE